MNDTKSMMRYLGAGCWAVLSAILLHDAWVLIKYISRVNDAIDHIPGYIYLALLLYLVLGIAMLVSTVYMFMNVMEKAGYAMQIAGWSYLAVAVVLMYQVGRGVQDDYYIFIALLFAAMIAVVVSMIMLGSTLKGVHGHPFRSLISYGVFIGIVLLVAFILSGEFGGGNISPWQVSKIFLNQSGWIWFIWIAGHLFTDLAMKPGFGGPVRGYDYGNSPYGSSGYEGYGAGAYGTPGYGAGPCGSSGYGGYGASVLERESARKHEEDLLRHGGWRCSRCKAVNSSFVGSCSCGLSREESERKDQEEALALREAKQKASEAKVQEELAVADALLKYKNLLDHGVITQEEFDEKKKQIMSTKSSKSTQEPAEDGDEWECDNCHKKNSMAVKAGRNCGRVRILIPRYRDEEARRTQEEKSGKLHLTTDPADDEAETVSMAAADPSPYSQNPYGQNPYGQSGESAGYGQPYGGQNYGNYASQPYGGYGDSSQVYGGYQSAYDGQQSSTSFCPYCGAPAAPNDMFCNACGQKLK